MPSSSPSFHKSGFLVVVVVLIAAGVKCSGVPSGHYVQVDAEMKNTTKEVGDSVKLHCEITGNPVPEYNWVKDHRPIGRLNSRRHLVESIPWGSRLIIENLNSDDTGWYSCIASNHHDNQTTSAYLSVVPIGNLTGNGVWRSGAKRRKNRPFSDDDFEDGGYDYDEDDDKMEYEIVYVENGEVDKYENTATKNQKKNQNKSRPKSKPEQTGRHSPCSTYTGKLCRSAFNNQTVRLSVMNSVVSHSSMDKKLGALSDAMLATSADDLCTRIAVTFLCRMSYRVCDSGSGLGAYIPAMGYYDQQGGMAPLCKEDCRVFESERCSTEREIIRVSTLVGDNQNLLIRDSMCSASTSVDQPTPPCVWGPPISTGNEAGSGGFPQMPYVAATMVVILLGGCLGLIFYGRRRQQQKKDKKQQHELESNKRKALLSSKEQPVTSPSAPTFSPSSPVRTVSGVNVTFLYPIGNGHFGPVYAAQLLDQQSPILVRQTQPQHVIAATMSEHADLTSKSRFECEMRALSSLSPDHPNVLRCVAICPVGSPRSILFELVDGVDLKQNLLHLSAGVGGLELMTALDYCCQVARGFEYLAERSYYHGDLSARNVLVPRTVDRNLRITNLGVSRQVYESDYCVGPCGQILPLRWCPSERVMMAEASPATEIWSFGVLLWEILSGGLRPYISLSDTQLLEEMNQAKHPTLQLPATCPEDVCRIVEECWHPEPSKRVAAGVLRRNLEGASFRVYNNNVCLPNFNTLGNRVMNDAILHHSYPYNPQNQALSRAQQSSGIKTQHISPATSSNQTSSTSAINSPSRLNHALSLGERVDDGSDVNIKQYTC